LNGELGAGKSTFARALIRAAGHQGVVPSPTYTLVEPYKLASGNIYHIDLYRVSDEEELHYLGWDELDDGLCLVEWAERAPGLGEAADLIMKLEYAGDSRLARIEALSDRGLAVTQRIN
jgi:tRNA threonylcarbamoyladenosine biosynthesis protein TsaE